MGYYGARMMELVLFRKNTTNYIIGYNVWTINHNQLQASKRIIVVLVDSSFSDTETIVNRYSNDYYYYNNNTINDNLY